MTTFFKSPLGCKFSLSISYDRNREITRCNERTGLEKENRCENSRLDMTGAAVLSIDLL